jgi:hypothetical protein
VKNDEILRQENKRLRTHLEGILKEMDSIIRQREKEISYFTQMQSLIRKELGLITQNSKPSIAPKDV